MSTDDLSDLLGKLPKKRKSQEEQEESQKANEALDFLGSFKKRASSSSSEARSDSTARAKPSGITPLEIADLPEPHKSIMMSMLRNKTASTDGVTIDDLQEQFDFADENDLIKTLNELANEEWLVVHGDPPDQRYKLNFRRKRGRLGADIWSTLSDD